MAEEEADSEQEGLAVLLPDIQATASLVLRCTAAYQESQESRAEGSAVATNNSITRGALSADEQYLAVMKPLQFGRAMSLIGRFVCHMFQVHYCGCRQQGL